MPKEGYESWSVPTALCDWIRELVDMGIPPYGKYKSQGYENYVATVGLDLLEKALYDLTVKLTPEGQDRIWKRGRGNLPRLDTFDAGSSTR